MRHTRLKWFLIIVYIPAPFLAYFIEPLLVKKYAVTINRLARVTNMSLTAVIWLVVVGLWFPDVVLGTIG